MFSSIHLPPEQPDSTFEPFVFDANEGEEESRFIEQFSNSPGTLKTETKQYNALIKPDLTPYLKEGHRFVPYEGLKQHPLTQTAHRPQNYSELNSAYFRSTPLAEGKPMTPFSTTASRPAPPHLPKSTPNRRAPETAIVKNTSTPAQIKKTVSKTPPSSTRLEKGREPHQQISSLQSHRWTHEETRSWWEDRYHHRDREEREGGQHQHSQQEQQREREKEPIKVQKARRSEKIVDVNGKTFQTKKPLLSQPKIGVYALYYILTKIGIVSDAASNYDYKDEISYLDTETTSARQKRLEELKVVLEKEQSAQRWGIAYKVFSWIASFLGIIAGVGMIATGIGAIGGAMLIAGGIINLTSQILEMTGGWHKIAEILPGDDPDKKRAVISWIQTGVAVLCLILSGVGIFFGGFSNFSESTQAALALFGSIAMIGQGVTAIGEGITNFMYCDKLSEVKQYELKLAQLKHRREDLMEKVEWGVDRLQQLFEDLVRVLGFYNELFQADQKINKQ